MKMMLLVLMIKIIIFSFLLIDAKKGLNLIGPVSYLTWTIVLKIFFFAKHMLIQNCLIV